MLLKLPTDLFTSSTWRFPKHRVVVTIQYVTFSDWLVSLGNMCLRVLYLFWGGANVFAAHNSPLLCSAESFLVWMYNSLSLSPTEEHFGCFQVLLSMNKAAVNIRAAFSASVKFQLFWVNIKDVIAQS